MQIGWFKGSSTYTSDNTTANLNPSNAIAITVTAQWVGNRFNTISNMQQISSTMCNNASVGTQNTLTDTRDNSTYTVLKAKDGKCWMTQNLKLVGVRTLTTADSDVITSFSLPATRSSWVETYTSAMVYYTNSVLYGAHYNYYAASAGTISGSNNTTEASHSICPKGWRIPTNSEYDNLLKSYNVENSTEGSNILTSAPLRFVFSGYHENAGTGISTGDSGFWWSSTANGGDSRLNLAIYPNSNTAHDTNGWTRQNGKSLRCVAR